MKFKCHCNMHMIDVDIKPLNLMTDYIGMTIYNHRSEQTGKLLKKPKEMGTVVLIGKEAKKFAEYFKNEFQSL